MITLEITKPNFHIFFLCGTDTPLSQVMGGFNLAPSNTFNPYSVCLSHVRNLQYRALQCSLVAMLDNVCHIWFFFVNCLVINHAVSSQVAFSCFKVVAFISDYTALAFLIRLTILAYIYFIEL